MPPPPNTETSTTTRLDNMYNIFKYLLLALLCLTIGGDGEELADGTKTKTIIPLPPDDPLDLPPLFQDVSYRLIYKCMSIKYFYKGFVIYLSLIHI